VNECPNQSFVPLASLRNALPKLVLFGFTLLPSSDFCAISSLRSWNIFLKKKHNNNDLCSIGSFSFNITELKELNLQFFFWFKSPVE